MSRDLPTGFADAVNADQITPILLAELEWPSGTVRFWTGYQDLSWNGYTWSPSATFGGVSDVKETSDQTANGLTLSLSGLDAGVVASVLSDDFQGRAARVYFGLVNISTGALAVDPYLLFEGKLDAGSLTEDGKTATISITVERELIDNRSGARRYTHEDQKIDYPSDLGFEFVTAIASKSFAWGRSAVPAVNSMASGSDQYGVEEAQQSPY